MAERNDVPHKIAEVLRAVAGKTEKKYFTSAVILAAGSSTRMMGESKQFILIDGIPAVARSVMEFDKSPCIDEIIIVSKKDEMALYNDFADTYNIQNPLKVIEGGETRQESARKGVDAVDDRSKFINSSCDKPLIASYDGVLTTIEVVSVISPPKSARTFSPVRVSMAST